MRFSLPRLFKQPQPALPEALPPESFLKQCRAIIHLGANAGQERDLYQSFHLDVLWIEALPIVFEQLKANLAAYPRQAAVQALIASQSGEKKTFHISDNEGLSSSLFDLADHKKLWPDVGYNGEVELVTSTLDDIVSAHWKKGRPIDALIMDIQGAELLALQGAGESLRQVRFIKAEAADFESYAGSCSLHALDAFVSNAGFRLKNKERFAGQEGVGNYFDVLWERSA